MGTSEIQSLLEPPPKTNRTRNILAILCFILAIALFVANTREYWKGRMDPLQYWAKRTGVVRPSIFETAPAMPAWAAPLDEVQKFAEAEKRVTPDDWSQALAVFLNLAQKAGTEELRAQSTLYAAEILLWQKSDRPGAEEVYRYFLQNFPGQPGADKAGLDLGMLEVEGGQLAEGLYLLTSVVADHPDSPHAATAALMAQRTALALSVRESRANFQVAAWFRSILPANPFSLTAYATFTLTTILWLFLSPLSSKERRRSPTAWVISLLYVLISVMNFAVNKKDQKETAPQMVERPAPRSMNQMHGPQSRVKVEFPGIPNPTL